MDKSKGVFIAVDPAKLADAFKRRGIKKKDASRALAKSDAYINARLKDYGTLSEQDMIIFEHKFHITPEEVAPDIPVLTEEIPDEESAFSAQDWKKLKETMVAAFKEALQG